MTTDTGNYVLEPRYIDGVRIAARTVTYPGSREEPPDDVTYLEVGEDGSIVGDGPRQYGIQLDGEAAAMLVRLALPFLEVQPGPRCPSRQALVEAALIVLGPLLPTVEDDDPDPTDDPF